MLNELKVFFMESVKKKFIKFQMIPMNILNAIEIGSARYQTILEILRTKAVKKCQKASLKKKE